MVKTDQVGDLHRILREMASSATRVHARVLKLFMLAALPFFAGTSSSWPFLRISVLKIIYIHVARRGACPVGD